VRPAKQHRRAQALRGNAGHDRGFDVAAASLSHSLGGLLLRGGRDGVHVHDERRPPEPAGQRPSGSQRRTGGHRNEYHVSAGCGFNSRVLDLHVATRASTRPGGLIDVLSSDPGRARRVQILGKDAADLAEANDRECRHARPRLR
jgi:hypothetical protein